MDVVLSREDTARGRGSATKASTSTGAPPDPTAAFFAELSRREREPLLAKASGTARFDIAGDGRTDHWYVAIEKGAITVSRRRARADAVVRANRETFDRLAAGEENVMAAAMREELVLDGDPRLLVRLQRLFPRPQSLR